MDFDSLQDETPKPQAPANSGATLPSFDSLQDDSEKYGGASGALKTAALSAADTSTFGLSSEFLTHTGAMKPEDIAGYEKENPIARGVGVGAGILGMLAAGPESAAAKSAAEALDVARASGNAARIAEATEAAKSAGKTLKGFQTADLLNPVKTLSRAAGSIAEGVAPSLNPVVGKVLGQAGAMGLGSAVEGTAFGLGQAVHEDALGDPQALGEKLLGHLGAGALTGFAAGSLFGGITASLEARAAKSLGSTPPPDASAPFGGSQPGAGKPLIGAPSSGVSDAPKTGVQPTTYQEMADKVTAAKASGVSVDLPQKAVLNDAVSRVAMDNPVHPLQMKSLEDQGSRDLYNTFKEMPSQTGDVLRNYEALQKNELVNKTGKAISELSPGAAPTADAAEGGGRAIKAFTDQYQAEKNELSPIFNKLKTTPLVDTGDVLSGVVSKMSDAVPGVAKMFKTEGEDLSVLPYKTSWGIDKATYNAAKEAVESLKENPGDFESLANIRRGMDQHVDILAQGQAPAQIRALKAAMMDFMQDAVQNASPDVEVRDAFRRYAINEQERSVIEKTFGASVGSPEFGAASKIKPEIIGDKIFSNTASAQAAKNILPSDRFNEVLANWLSEAKAAATDKGVFSSNKFGSFLKKNQDALRVAFKDNPEGLQHLNDLTTIMRILPDAASINPSGTAKTLIGMLKSIPHDISWEGMLKFIPEKILEKVGEQRQLGQLQNELLGKSASVDGLSLVERTTNKVNNSISSGAAGIFSEKGANKAKSAIINMSIQERQDNHDTFAPDLSELNENPEKMIDHLSKNTEVLSQIAPKTSQSVQGAMTRATQFLQSKLPGNNIPQKPLSPKYQPSNAELAKWHAYFSAVDAPTDVLHSVAAGTIIPEQMEALAAVYPKMLSEMQSAVTEKMTAALSKKQPIPYRTKLALSMFLGSDLVNSLDPKSMLATQNTLSTATMAKQQGEMAGANKKSLGKIDKSNRFMTPMQQSAQREDA